MPQFDLAAAIVYSALSLFPCLWGNATFSEHSSLPCRCFVFRATFSFLCGAATFWGGSVQTTLFTLQQFRRRTSTLLLSSALCGVPRTGGLSHFLFCSSLFCLGICFGDVVFSCGYIRGECFVHDPS
uniref:Uncharacterized protein n=1 Tax=Ixodes ricinus TaxID=34613 RepID=A0A6B0UQD4_IXORI